MRLSLVAHTYSKTHVWDAPIAFWKVFWLIASVVSECTTRLLNGLWNQWPDTQQPMQQPQAPRRLVSTFLAYACRTVPCDIINQSAEVRVSLGLQLLGIAQSDSHSTNRVRTTRHKTNLSKHKKSAKAFLPNPTVAPSHSANQQHGRSDPW